MAEGSNRAIGVGLLVFGVLWVALSGLCTAQGGVPNGENLTPLVVAFGIPIVALGMVLVWLGAELLLAGKASAIAHLVMAFTWIFFVLATLIPWVRASEDPSGRRSWEIFTGIVLAPTLLFLLGAFLKFRKKAPPDG